MPLSNAEIADRLASLAQLLSTQKENPYKIRAYQRAAQRIRTFPESLDELAREEADLTRFPGVGDAIASAIREIVHTGTLKKIETLRSEVSQELVELSSHPRLDPRRVLRAYKKLKISSIAELQQKLESGELEKTMGVRLAQHVRQGLTDTHAILLYRADPLSAAIENFLVGPAKVRRAQAAGDCRRRVEAIEELVFVIETDDFPFVISRLQRYGGHMPLVESSEDHALFALSAGVLLRIQLATTENWGTVLISATGSKAHLKKLDRGRLPAKETEEEVYGAFGLSYIEPELREGRDEITLAARHELPKLVTEADIRGELHAHSTSSDGADSIEDMALAARARGYEYIGITDHSQSLKIARGLPVEDLWEQIRFIDVLNSRLMGIRVLKSAEVDILADGSLDYPNDLLRELDYTVCSIHSRFALNKEQQTERILRAMDNPNFNILGHATGRLILKRPGYEIDVDRVIAQARARGCFFEINSSPDRLDLSAENARLAREAGVKIAISTDAHSTGEFHLVRYGIDQARRAGMEPSSVLNCLPLQSLSSLFHR